MIMQHIILGLLWIVYCALHSLLAATSFKMKAQAFMKESYKYYRLFYTLFAFGGLVALLVLQLNTRTFQVFHATRTIELAGAFVTLSGLLIMAVCIKKYFLSLSGIKSLVTDTAVQQNTLVVTGIHRFIRHPLYLGTFLFIWGLWIVFPAASLLVSNSIITLYTLVAIRWEEEKLIAEFGNNYREYREKVPALLPRLYRRRAD